MAYLETIPVPRAASEWRRKQLGYRVPMQVTAVRLFRTAVGEDAYPLCPRCGVTLEREYQVFCDRCGQRPDWAGFADAGSAVEFQ